MMSGVSAMFLLIGGIILPILMIHLQFCSNIRKVNSSLMYVYYYYYFLYRQSYASLGLAWSCVDCGRVVSGVGVRGVGYIMDRYRVSVLIFHLLSCVGIVNLYKYIMSLSKSSGGKTTVEAQTDAVLPKKFAKLKRVPDGSVLTRVNFQEFRVLKTETIYLAYLDFIRYDMDKTESKVSVHIFI